MPHDIYQETPLIPYLIAEQVAGIEDEKAVTYLEKKAERIYENSAHFRASVNNPRSDPRQVLEMFIGHWLQSYRTKLKKRQVILN